MSENGVALLVDRAESLYRDYSLETVRRWKQSTGGLAADAGLLRAMQEAAEAKKGKSGLIIRGHEQSVLAGAYEAALWGAFRARGLARDGMRFEAGSCA